MKVVYHFFLLVLIICIPLISIFAAFNVVLRMPDLYVYEFNKTEITKEIKLNIENDELGGVFSDFMLGKNKVFQLNAEYEGRELEIFSINDQKNMENLRHLLNIMLIVMGVMFVITFISYWILISMKNKLDIRNAFKGGVILYSSITILSFLAFYISFLRDIIYKFIFISPMKEDSVLSLMLTKHFANDCLIAGSVIAAIILIIFASITWNLTKPRRMFG